MWNIYFCGLIDTYLPRALCPHSLMNTCPPTSAPVVQRIEQGPPKS